MRNAIKLKESETDILSNMINQETVIHYEEVDLE